MLDQLPEEEPPDIDQPDNTSDAEMGEILNDPPQQKGTSARDITISWQSEAKNHGKAQATHSHIPRAQASEGATSPERRAHSAHVDQITIRTRPHPNRFHQIREESNHESGRGSDKIREGSISGASSSRGGRMRDPVMLTPEILAMPDRHEPNKTKQTKLLMKHLAGQRILPSTKEEL